MLRKPTYKDLHMVLHAVTASNHDDRVQVRDDHAVIDRNLMTPAEWHEIGLVILHRQADPQHGDRRNEQYCILDGMIAWRGTRCT